MNSMSTTMIKMKSKLIAPCGLNCAACYAFLRKKDPCPGCRYDTTPKPVSRLRCKMKSCSFFSETKAKYCYECSEFPCKPLKQLDKRYRTKYHVSVIENLQTIKRDGIRKFLAQEANRWTCRNCSGTICIHTQICSGCG